jgi:Mn-dependent DtxR family transcriptional regulator
LGKWFWAIYRMAQGKKGLLAIQLMKEFNVSYPTAWLMLQKLRQAMQRREAQYLWGGVIQLDDGNLGGQ